MTSPAEDADGTDHKSDGGMGMSRRESIPNDNISKPNRDLDAVSETLRSVSEGERLKIGMAIDHPDTGETGGTSVMKVVNVEAGAAGFDRRVSLLHYDGDVYRLYMTGDGHEEMDPWEIVSCPYDPETGTADMRDFAAHGWVVGAEVFSE